MIRVFYDSQIFLAQTRGGISRYFVELVRQFRNRPELGIEPVINLTSSNNLHALEDLGISLRNTHKTKAQRSIDFASQAVGDRKFRDYDLRHFTFYSRLYSNFSGRTVTTLYDMIPEKIGYRWRNPHMSKRLFMQKSTGVLSISNTSLEDLHTTYGFTPDLVAVTHLGAGDEFAEGGAVVPIGLPDQYLLFVGRRDGYKRGAMALEALARMNFPEVCLLFVGPDAATSNELQLIARLGLEGRVFFRNASGAELPTIYSRASVLLYPNLYEGFGFPPIEARLSGVPVIGVDNAINREISGSQMLYFDENDVGAMASLANRVIREGLAAPRQNADSVNSYTWEVCAERTADFYHVVMQSKSDSS